MKKLNVVCLYKHNIVHKNVKNYHKKTFIMSMIICMVAVFSFVYLGVVNDTVKLSTNAFNPISELYRDVEVASFVSGGSVSFIVPVKTDKYTVNQDNIVFEVTSSIMVYAPCDGVIEEINIDKNKYIKIKHSNELYSMIYNVDVVGVKAGDVVKQGKEIATAKPNNSVVFCIINNDKRVENLYLNKSFVKWKLN